MRERPESPSKRGQGFLSETEREARNLEKEEIDLHSPRFSGFGWGFLFFRSMLITPLISKIPCVIMFWSYTLTVSVNISMQVLVYYRPFHQFLSLAATVDHMQTLEISFSSICCSSWLSVFWCLTPIYMHAYEWVSILFNQFDWRQWKSVFDTLVQSIVFVSRKCLTPIHMCAYQCGKNTLLNRYDSLARGIET